MMLMKGGDMKRLVGMIIITAAFFAFQHNAWAEDQLRIGVLDIQRCITESNEGKRISSSLQKDLEAMQQRYNEAQQELSELQEEIEKQSLMLSLDAKENKQKEYNKKLRDLNYLAQDLNEEASKAEDDAKKKILMELEVIVQGVALKQNLDLILEKLSSGVLFYTDALDITDQVIEEFNEARP
jgi:outer membrane protein